MQRAHLGIVENEKVESERERRRVPELQHRPRNAGQGENGPGGAGWLAPTQIRGSDQLADVQRGLVGVGCHAFLADVVPAEAGTQRL